MSRGESAHGEPSSTKAQSPISSTSSTHASEEEINHKVVNTEPLRQEKYTEADAGDGTKAHEQYLHGVPLLLTILSCIVTLFIAALDQTIVSTILTTVGDHFNSFEKVGWLTSGFMLPMACLIPSYGKISIAFGRKATLIGGIIVFEIGSLISALANSMSLLIGGRVIQGVGGGAIQSMVMVILTESVPISRRSLVFASVSIVWSTSSVLGPIIGGALEKITWRWCFYINLPIGGVSLLVLIFGFHPPKPKGNIREKLSTIDYVGTFFMTSGLVLVLLGLTFGGIDFPWRSAAVICLFTIGGVLLIIFAVWNFRFSTNPIILAEFIKSPTTMTATISAMFNFGFFISNLTYLAVYFQVVFNASSLQSGIDLLPLVVSVTIASLANSMFINLTKNVKITMVVSGVLSPLGSGLLLLLDKNSSVGKRIGILLVSGIAIGLQFQSSTLSAQLVAPKHVPGALILVTVLLNFARELASTVSVTIAQLLFQTTGTRYIKDLQLNVNRNIDGYNEFTSMSAKSLISNPRLVRTLPNEVRELVLDQFVKALKNVFYFGLALAAVCFIASLFTTGKKIPKTKDIKTADSEDEKSQAEEMKAVNGANDSPDQETNMDSSSLGQRQ
ncbi:SGE1 [Candida margitis]|uniref:SGE1 n=1 Tax=Candida margitis TaxID=1775924 RepID=UPI0022260790|nr:SGE1 [Candida margitis]KAI5970273.1 SGE1 [Candida margitis]